MSKPRGAKALDTAQFTSSLFEPEEKFFPEFGKKENAP